MHDATKCLRMADYWDMTKQYNHMASVQLQIINTGRLERVSFCGGIQVLGIRSFGYFLLHDDDDNNNNKFIRANILEDRAQWRNKNEENKQSSRNRIEARRTGSITNIG